MDIYSSLTSEELVRRCASSIEVGVWQEFVRRFHRLIASVVLRTASRLGDPSVQTADDLIQETYLKLCADNFALLRDFTQQHPDAFVGFIQVVTANVVRDSFRNRHSQKRGNQQIQVEPERFEPAAGPNAAGNPKAIERWLLIGEIEDHLAACLEGADRSRNMKVFWLYYRAGLSSAAIAALPDIGLTTKGVESMILRMTRAVRDRIRSSHSARRAGSDPEGILPTESF
ncbi:MAG: sigma-70 family RNA polymerase sigma factor [Acidobacteriaceae bacterium]